MKWVVALIIGVIGLNIWWMTYFYKDCKAVGHSTLYCIVQMGK